MRQNILKVKVDLQTEPLVILYGPRSLNLSLKNVIGFYETINENIYTYYVHLNYEYYIIS